MALLIIAFKSVAQMAVVDAGANSNLSALNKAAIKSNSTMTSSLAKAVSTLKELTAIKENYDKQLEMVSEVSDMVKDSKQVFNMQHTLTDIKNEFKKGVSYCQKEKDIKAADKNKFAAVYLAMLEDTFDDFEYGLKIVTDGSLKMNDAERLSILSNVETKMRKKKGLMVYFHSKIKHAVAQQAKRKKQNEELAAGVQSLNGK